MEFLTLRDDELAGRCELRDRLGPGGYREGDFEIKGMTLRFRPIDPPGRDWEEITILNVTASAEPGKIVYVLP